MGSTTDRTAKPPRKKPGPSARAKMRALRAELERTAAGGPGSATIAGTVFGPPKPPELAPSPPPDALVELGPPPADPLEANAWAHRAVLLAMHSAATDHRINERERRKEIRTLGASAAKLFPDTRRWEAEQLIKSDRAELERKRRKRAVLEPRPAIS